MLIKRHGIKSVWEYKIDYNRVEYLIKMNGECILIYYRRIIIKYNNILDR